MQRQSDDDVRGEPGEEKWDDEPLQPPQKKESDAEAGPYASTRETTPLYIIVSHQARIKCLLTSLFSAYKSRKYKNGAIITFEVKEGGAVTDCDLIWTGGVDPNAHQRLLRTWEHPLSDASEVVADADGQSKVSGGVLPGRYIIIRHGDGVHNQVKRVSMLHNAATRARQALTSDKNIASNVRMRDAQLTELGSEQADFAGEKLGQYIWENRHTLSLRTPCYCSDLLRTQQTLALVLDGAARSILNRMEGAGARIESPNLSKKCTVSLVKALLVVLPCNHEVSSTNTNCTAEVERLGPENKPFEMQSSVDGHTVDADFYHFYYKKVYGKEGRKDLDSATASRCGQASNLLHSIYLYNLFAKGKQRHGAVARRLPPPPRLAALRPRAVRQVLAGVGPGISTKTAGGSSRRTRSRRRTRKKRRRLRKPRRRSHARTRKSIRSRRAHRPGR